MEVYLLIGVKLIVGFIVIAVYIHLSGKGSLAPISALDQIGNIVLGAIIGGSLYNPDIGVLLLTLAAGAWGGLLLLVRYVSFRLGLVKNVVDGSSIRLMKNGRVLSDNFTQARISTRDFIMLLHQRGYSNLNELKSIWFEYNGQLTVVKKGDEAMATVLIENGQMREDNMKDVRVSKKHLLAEIKKKGYTLDQVFIAEWHNEKLWIYPRADAEKAPKKTSQVHHN